ncbi:transposase [Lichenicoccus roseus]|uniref:Transposase n=1 Tax=Lichenicoccus roseus TaxID=2683649 RepID=A0A5R9IZ81_9PROT|nr:transposase [Lichenicoccus roseus]
MQAIGVSRGGRTTKIYALTDGLGRLVAFCLTPGYVADCRAAEGLLQGLPHSALVMADRAYDTNVIRPQIDMIVNFSSSLMQVNI